MIREPYLFIERQAKVPAMTGKLSTQVFVDFFLQEVRLRESRGRVQLGPDIVTKYGKMLTKQAQAIWEVSQRMQTNAVNLAFIFLNRYYAMFTKENPVPKMRYFWEEFLINISHEETLLALLNYSDERRAEICTVIQEIRETKKSKAFAGFVARHAKGYKVNFPVHDKERSKMFETVLLMSKQLDDGNFDYFKKNHAMEIVKAHVWGLHKHGNPVQLYLGNFIGETAMYRLQNYQEWINKVGRTNSVQSAMGGLHGDEF